MTLRIFSAIFTLSFLFGTAGFVNAAEQPTNQSSPGLEMKASSSEMKKDFRPKKPKKLKKKKPRKRHCDAY